MAKTLEVLISGKRAGQLHQANNGMLTFAYRAGYSTTPLSLTMPISGEVFGDKIIRPFLFGLLPDSYDVRRSLGLEYGVSPDNPFALLAHIGLDCPGAVQFCAESATEEVLHRSGSLIPISDSEIAARLARGRGNREARWETNQERWSLGGQQAKFALRRENNAWYSCAGSAATTHIFKPGIADLRLSALNEFVCLKLAKACDLAACDVAYEIFDDEPAIIATRYDRVRNDNGEVIRLHQEDFCQVLGVLPGNKYAEEGGPSAKNIIAVCKQTGQLAAQNVSQFMDMLFFNYLLGAPDAHGKNYSLLLGVDSAYIAPLYDVASLLPYVERPGDIKLAMGVAGENRVGRLSAQRLEKFAETNQLGELGISGDGLVNQLAKMAALVPRKLEAVLAESSYISGIDELGDRLLPRVTALCERSLARLS